MIATLFPKESENREDGGLFFQGSQPTRWLFFRRKGNLKFVYMPNIAAEMHKDEKEAYANPRVQEYAPNLGLLHTHPLEEARELRELAGPSGYAKFYPDYDAYRGDLGSLRKMLHGNPYNMDIVVTELGQGKYNIDAYFSDVVCKDEFVRWKRNLTVIDLGIFEYPLGGKEH